MDQKAKTRSFDVEAFNSPAWEEFRKHRSAVLAVPADAAGYRGCMGLGLSVEPTSSDSWIEVIGASETRLFIPDKAVRWLNIVDVPYRYFALDSAANAREVNWATSRPTTMKYGAPTLEYATEDGAWDIRAMPGTPHATLTPESNPRLFKAFNALNWAMSSTAFAFRAKWQPHKAAFFGALGRAPTDDKVLLFGQGDYSDVQVPEAWMPRAYMGFPLEARETLFTRVTYLTAGVPSYSDGLQREFTRQMTDCLAYAPPFAGMVSEISREVYCGINVVKLVLSGDLGERTLVRFGEYAKLRVGVHSRFTPGMVIAHEPLKLPRTWDNMSWVIRWNYVNRILAGVNLHMFLKIWFERQMLELDGENVHLPCELAQQAGVFGSTESSLYWDVSRGMEYFREDCDTFVYPTLRMHGWSQFTGTLPGGVAYNVTPSDPRFVFGPVDQSKKLPWAAE